MPERTVQIVNKAGLHARPAAEIVKLAAKYRSDITVVREDLESDRVDPGAHQWRDVDGVPG